MGGKGEGGQDIEGEKKEKKHVRRWWSSVNQKWVRHSCISRRPFQVHLVTQYEVVSMATRLQTFFSLSTAMLAELCKVLHIDLFLSFYSKPSTKKRELAEGLTAAAEARTC